MKTISNREFIANPELYLDMATEQEVRIRKGRRVIRLVNAPPASAQSAPEPGDDLRRAISSEEFRKHLVVAMKRVDEKYAHK